MGRDLRRHGHDHLAFGRPTRREDGDAGHKPHDFGDAVEVTVATWPPLARTRSAGAMAKTSRGAARRCPHLVEGQQVLVHERRHGGRMPDRRHAADRVAGGLAHDRGDGARPIAVPSSSPTRRSSTRLAPRGEHEHRLARSRWRTRATSRSGRPRPRSRPRRPAPSACPRGSVQGHVEPAPRPGLRGLVEPMRSIFGPRYQAAHVAQRSTVCAPLGRLLHPPVAGNWSRARDSNPLEEVYAVEQVPKDPCGPHAGCRKRAALRRLRWRRQAAAAPEAPARRRRHRVTPRAASPAAPSRRTTRRSRTTWIRRCRTRRRAGPPCGTSYTPLLTYKHAEGAEGATLIPGLAEALPEISPDGKTYTLKLRQGLKYSDGIAGQGVGLRAHDQARAEPGVRRLARSTCGIVGAEDYVEGRQARRRHHRHHHRRQDGRDHDQAQGAGRLVPYVLAMDFAGTRRRATRRSRT